MISLYVSILWLKHGGYNGEGYKTRTEAQRITLFLKIYNVKQYKKIKCRPAIFNKLFDVVSYKTRELKQIV